MTLEQEKMKIEKACLKEAKAIFELVRQAFVKYKQGKKNPHLQENLEDVKQDIKNNIVLVLKDNHKIVGSLRLVSNNDKNIVQIDRKNSFYLKKFAITPEYQGQGFGSKLFEKAEAITLKHGYQKIFLHSSIENKRLVKFYQELGFECIEFNQDMGYKRGLWLKELG